MCSYVSCPSSCLSQVPELSLPSFPFPCPALLVDLAFAGFYEPHFAASPPPPQALLEPAQYATGVSCKCNCSRALLTLHNRLMQKHLFSSKLLCAAVSVDLQTLQHTDAPSALKFNLVAGLY